MFEQLRDGLLVHRRWSVGKPQCCLRQHQTRNARTVEHTFIIQTVFSESRDQCERRAEYDFFVGAAGGGRIHLRQLRRQVRQRARDKVE